MTRRDGPIVIVVADPIPIACSLSDADATQQLGEWRDLGAALTGSAEVDGGVRLRFDASVEATLRDLARREAACCPFLSLVVARDEADGTVTVDVTSTQADARPVIDAIAHAIRS